MFTFSPDLIVEVTSACNRACKGCYAPNVVSNKSAEELQKQNPGLFLDLQKLRNLLIEWNSHLPSLISIRGGEPSIHPTLSNIIYELAQFNSGIVLETHGRWLLEKNTTQFMGLINALVMSKAKVKISFDSMHGIKADDLLEMTKTLSSYGIGYLVAITEKTDEELVSTRMLCSWVKDENIIFQRKAERADELLIPSIGVINVRGDLVRSLNSKFDIRDMIQDMAI